MAHGHVLSAPHVVTSVGARSWKSRRRSSDFGSCRCKRTWSARSYGSKRLRRSAPVHTLIGMLLLRLTTMSVCFDCAGIDASFYAVLTLIAMPFMEAVLTRTLSVAGQELMKKHIDTAEALEQREEMIKELLKE
eukprot:3845267-Rhodomonas_salina.1